MLQFRVGAAVLVLASASYADIACAEGRFGAAMPKGRTAGPVAAPAKIAGKFGPDADLGGAARSSKMLGGLAAEGQSTTRGAKESRVYQMASPAVVLIATDDAFGSGALIDAKGLIITNLHVVGDDDEVAVLFKPKVEGEKVGKADVRVGKVIRRDEVADLALVQVSEVPAGVTPLVLGGSNAIQIGSDVHAIGHPTGEAWTYTRGIVSQIRKDYSWTAEDKIKHTATVVQTQTPINPGNSGGPLLDDKLEIIGINSFASEGEGMNFAVSAGDVKALMARKEDRILPGKAKAKATAKAAADKECEVEAVAMEKVKDPPGKDVLLDTDCDGEGDVLSNVPDDESEPITYMFDDDADGKIETFFFDNDRDGEFDTAVYDTDGNGKPDMVGEFKPGESEPYRFEKIAEK